MAKIDVIMPQMGESIAEGTLSRWMKKVGDPIKRDEPIFEISTDKVDAEIPAPAAGVLAEILVQEGQTVEVQTVVARIETDASVAAEKPKTAAPPAAATPAPPTPAPPAPPKGSSRPSEPPAPPKSAPAAAPSRSAPAAAAASAAPETRAVSDATGGNGAVESVEERLQRKSTPLVRKMAAEHKVDISAVPGTGLSGRVTKNDILSYIEGGEAGKRGGGEVGKELRLP